MNTKYQQEYQKNQDNSKYRHIFLQGKRSCRGPGETTEDDIVPDLIQESLEALMRAEQNIEKGRAEFRKKWEKR